MICYCFSYNYNLSGHTDSESWSYTFEEDGSYTVAAIVEDEERKSDSITWHIKVEAKDRFLETPAEKREGEIYIFYRNGDMKLLKEDNTWWKTWNFNL